MQVIRSVLSSSNHPRLQNHSPGLLVAALGSAQELQSSLLIPSQVAHVGKHVLQSPGAELDRKNPSNHDIQSVSVIP